jgi:uncharacterized membrane protein
MVEQYDELPRRDRSGGPVRALATGQAQSWPDRRQGGRNGHGGGSGLGIVGLALVAAAGVAAVGLIGAQLRDGSLVRTGTAPDRRSAAGHEPEVERSITIEDVSADELYQRWRDPETMRRIMAPFADVEPTGEERTHWSAGDLGSWDMRLADDRPGEFMRWEALGGDALIREVSVRFRPAGGDRGTVVVLRASLDPPGGMLGRIAARMLGDRAPAALAGKSLHYFKALVQTGEIPTTERQPAARPDPR